MVVVVAASANVFDQLDVAPVDPRRPRGTSSVGLTAGALWYLPTYGKVWEVT